MILLAPPADWLPCVLLDQRLALMFLGSTLHMLAAWSLLWHLEQWWENLHCLSLQLPRENFKQTSLDWAMADGGDGMLWGLGAPLACGQGGRCITSELFAGKQADDDTVRWLES